MKKPKRQPLRVPPKVLKEIEELASNARKRACGEHQNLMQDGAWYDLFDLEGGMDRLGIDHAVIEGDELSFGYDPVDNRIVATEAAYNLLKTGREDVKFALAKEIGKALLLRPYLLAESTSRRPVSQEDDPNWQIEQFAYAFVIPATLLRKCLKDGMAPNKIVEYFGVSPETLDYRMKML